MTNNDNDSPIAAAVNKLADSVDRLASQLQMNTNALHPHLCCNQQLELEQPRDDDDAEQTPQTEDDDDCNIIANDNIDDDESSDDNSNGDQTEDEADVDDNNNDKDKDGSQEEKEQQDSNKRPDSKGNIGPAPSDMISTRSARDRAPPTRQTMAGASDSNSNLPTAWTRPRGSPCQCFPNACTCGLYETGPSYSNSTFPTAWTRPRGSPCQCLPNACTCSQYL